MTNLNETEQKWIAQIQSLLDVSIKSGLFAKSSDVIAVQTTIGNITGWMQSAKTELEELRPLKK